MRYLWKQFLHWVMKTGWDLPKSKPGSESLILKV